MSDAAERQRARRRELNKRASGSQSGGLASTLFEGAAMATGAFYGSAMLYRQGLGPTIERGLAFGSRFLSGMSERGTSKALEDWTISDARKLWKDSREVFRETQRSMRENPLVLDPSDNRTLFSVMSEFSQGRGRGSDAMFGRMWRQEGLINPTLDLYAQQASKWGHSENEQLRFQSFIKTVASSIHNEVAVDRIARDAFGKGTSLRKQADFFTEHLRKLDQDKKAKDAMKDRVSEGYKNLRKTAMDLDALERNQKKNRGGFLQRLWDSVSGTRAVTNRDIINNQNLAKSIKYQKQGPNGKIITKDPIQDILTAQKYWREHDKKHGTNFEERFLNLAPDVNGLRVDASGKFYSGEGSRKFFDNLTSSLANTLPGKILKMRAINQARIAPQFIEIAQGSRDPILAALTNSDKNKKSPYVDSSLFRIHGNYFRMDEKGGLENLGDLGGTHLIHGRYGATQHLLHQMEGSTRYKQGTNWFTRTFDLFQDRSEFGGSPLEGFRAMAEKSHDENYIGNIIEYWKNPTEENNIHFFGMRGMDGNINKDRVMDVLYKADKFHEFLSSTVRELDQDSARKMAAAVAPDSVAKSLFEALGTGSQEKIEEAILGMDPNKILSEDLANIANRLRSNRGSVYGTVIQKESGGRQHIGSNLADLVSTDYGNETMDGLKKMQVALGKEAILQTTTVEKGGKVNYQATFDIIDAANLGMRETEEAKRLAHLARFEDITHIQSFKDDADDFIQASNLHKMALDVRYAVTGSGSEKKDAIVEDFQDTIGNIKSEYINWQTKHYSEPDEIGNPIKYNEWVTMRDVVGPLDILKNLNDWTKTKATAKQFVKQFGAGRDNLGDVSEATLTPYFFLSRLSDDMNKVGLGFSKDNMGSTLDIAKAIMTKRVLPLWIGGTYYEWLDDTSQEVTGMSVSGAAAQGLANTDIALRKTMDIFGITDWMKGEKAINPIMQYWGDHNEFMDSDELRNWYANGYEPVRKGAWWTFGGVNEARGSEIAYWQPNFVRRIQSDYKDKALYDGYFDKWSHSLIPTPSNPLSPLMAILDPYWLEEKHKDDRPYELTGHMFEDGTPWGAILNPTIGEIIKPQKSLHTFLGFDYRNINGVDPKSLLHAINMNIKQRAADWGHRNYIQLSGGEYQPVKFNSFDAPTEDTKIMSMQFANGSVVNQTEGTYGLYSWDTGSASFSGIGENLLDVIDKVNNSPKVSAADVIDHELFGGIAPMQGVTIQTGSNGKNGVLTTDPDYNSYARSLFTEDRMKIDMMINGDVDNIKSNFIELYEKFNPKKALRYINEGTRNKAKAKIASPYDFDDSEGTVTSLKLKSYQPSQAMNLLNDAETVTDLINAGKGGDFVKEAAVSWRLVSGIYGYGLGAATGFGVDNQKMIATGQDITSFSRTFWDENLGGLGGSAMEIARRFIPDFRRGNRVNPLMNEMPDWLPDRFRYGDPWTSVPKGEMRLPGKGYESLNELHPDAYGDYGAFDRMKILADIAPFTPEYRMWRDIAKKTVTDPALIEEMAEIRERVNQQGKKHDFYDYQVVGHGLEYKNVVVSEILDYGKFRSGNTIYKLAGASVRGNADENMKEVLGRYIHVGQEVTVAVDEDPYARQNNDAIGSLGAAVFVDGENIALQMIESGDALKRKGDTSAPAILAQYGPLQKGIAYASELLAHVDVPWLSDQFLRVRSPLESYRAEQVYGTPYQSWEHPWDSFIEPAFIRAFHERTAFTGLIGTAYRYMHDVPGMTPGAQKLLGAGYLLSDRGAFIGAAIANFIDPGGRGDTSPKRDWTVRWARHTSAITAAGHVLTGGNSYADEAASAFAVGEEIGRFFEKKRGRAGVIGAAVGVAYRAAFGDEGNSIPGRTKANWEFTDYFDRLTYLKYQRLYKMAAKKAEEEEDVDLEEILEQREKKTEQNRLASNYFKSLKKKLQRNYPDSELRDEMMSTLNERINALEEDKMLLPGGEWTRTALIYKKAADSTMYALKEGASWSEIITALPTNDREYFMEFVKVRDPSKRAAILDTASPFLKKALSLAWGQDVPEQEDNESFFAKHELPQENWAGWAPQYDLKDVEVQTIENEALSLSDFGFYESQLRDPDVIDAPSVNYSGTSKGHNEAQVRKNLKTILAGEGLEDVDISVQAGPSGGTTSIIASIKTMMGFRDTQKRVNDSLSMYSA